MISMKNVALQFLSVLAVQAMSCHGMPHIIGGSVNLALPEDQGRFESLQAPKWLNTIVASAQLRQDSVEENGEAATTTESFESNESNDDISRIRSPGESLGPVLFHREEPSPLSTVGQGLRGLNPFLRAKRDAAACPIASDLPQQVQELNSFLGPNQFVGLEPEQSDVAPAEPEYNQCPVSSGSWWPQNDINLRSTCPWVYENLDNGPEFFPRYVRQAKCLCQDCILSTSMSCQKLNVPVTVFRRIGCQNGVALMEKTNVTVAVGCYCASPQDQQQQPTPGDFDDFNFS